MSTRDSPGGKGDRCVRLTNYHRCSAERQEIWGLNLPGPPWAISTACCGRELYTPLFGTELVALKAKRWHFFNTYYHLSALQHGKCKTYVLDGANKTNVPSGFLIFCDGRLIKFFRFFRFYQRGCWRVKSAWVFWLWRGGGHWEFWESGKLLTNWYVVTSQKACIFHWVFSYWAKLFYLY